MREPETLFPVRSHSKTFLKSLKLFLLLLLQDLCPSVVAEILTRVLSYGFVTNCDHDENDTEWEKNTNMLFHVIFGGASDHGGHCPSSVVHQTVL